MSASNGRGGPVGQGLSKRNQSPKQRLTPGARKDARRQEAAAARKAERRERHEAEVAAAAERRRVRAELAASREFEVESGIVDERAQRRREAAKHRRHLVAERELRRQEDA